MADLEDAVQIIKDVIKGYHTQEEELYAKLEDILKRREECESILEKIKKEAKTQKAIETPNKKEANKPPKGSISKEIKEALIQIMKYGGNWRSTDLHKEAQKVLGKEVSRYTLKSVLKSDNRFEKVALGEYSLSQEELNKPETET